MKKTATLGFDLLDVLLLGGKTELLNGQVWRHVSVGSADEAHTRFVALAQDICRWCGVEWSPSRIQAKRFDLERFHLEIAENSVDLQIDMPRSTWNAFR